MAIGTDIEPVPVTGLAAKFLSHASDSSATLGDVDCRSSSGEGLRTGSGTRGVCSLRANRFSHCAPLDLLEFGVHHAKQRLAVLPPQSNIANVGAQALYGNSNRGVHGVILMPKAAMSRRGYLIT